MKCPHCGAANAPGVLICVRCERLLVPIGTKQITGEPSAAAWGEVAPYIEIFLRVEGMLPGIGTRITDELTVGRWDGKSERPGIDLSPYGAYEAGVSRVHAVLIRDGQTLTIRDMGSSNGTWLNGNWLAAQKSYALADGAQLIFGKLRTLLVFGGAQP